MLTAKGCRERRLRLWERLGDMGIERLALSDRIHLSYFANANFDPISLTSDMPAVLLIDRGGRATLVMDRRSPHSVDDSHVDETVRTDWYLGSSPGQGPRQLALDGALAKLGVTGMHDCFGNPHHCQVVNTIADMRRSKNPDEVAALRSCMTACDAGHAWARTNLRAGMSELDVYSGVQAVCEKAAGKPVIVYGDFAVSPGPDRKGGPPTQQVLKSGDMIILDYSVVIDGYRSDFTNTIVIGGKPTPEQRRLFDLCLAAMKAGEAALRAGATCQSVYDAVNGVFAAAKMAEHFPHHAGHGLGLTHPEAPYFVRKSSETLLAGDVVTLEPGLYVTGIGGIRIEHNYLITDAGFERLSNHVIALN
jgi:Xaa-Pro aminopeptidase